MPSVRADLLAALPPPPEARSAADLIEATGRNASTVYGTLRRMLEKGELAQDGYGDYRLPDAAERQAGETRAELLGRVAVPTTPVGHGAGERRVSDGPALPTLFDEDQLRLMTGGRIPRYPDGRPRLVLSHAVGDSMAPHLPDGHPILYEPEAALVDGARYALWLGEAEADVVKRVALRGGGGVALVSDNPAVGVRRLEPTEDAEVWRDAEFGGTLRLRVLGRVLYPFDTGPAVFGQLAEFARTLLR